MNADKIKTMLNREVISQIKDYSTRVIIKNILFDETNKINWDSAYDMIMGFMPELNRYEGYSRENME